MEMKIDRSVEETRSWCETISCPVCGQQITDLWEYGSGPGPEFDTEIECPSCDRPLSLSRTISVTYVAHALAAKEE